MKKEDYMQMEKEYRRGTKMLIVMFVMIIVGALTLNHYYGI
jgi:hypothetical protein